MSRQCRYLLLPACTSAYGQGPIKSWLLSSKAPLHHWVLYQIACMQDQATALSNSVHDLQQQLQSLRLPDQIQHELQPIQDDVRRTSHDLNRSVQDLVAVTEPFTHMLQINPQSQHCLCRSNPSHSGVSLKKLMLLSLHASLIVTALKSACTGCMQVWT